MHFVIPDLIWMILIISVTLLAGYSIGHNEGYKVGTENGYRRGSKSVHQ